MTLNRAALNRAKQQNDTHDIKHSIMTANCMAFSTTTLGRITLNRMTIRRVKVIRTTISKAAFGQTDTQ
jgi:hypothetical protein